MGDYHRRRDARLLPGYRATLAFTRGAEPDGVARAWLAGALANPGLERALAMGFPAAARSPEVFPAKLLPVLERYARAFGAPADDEQPDRRPAA
jgi:hypothetical protein